MVFITNNTEETEKLGRILAEKIDKANLTKAYIALRGEMGVGKTAFVRGFASQFEISNVKSPTYTVVNEYRGRKSIYPFDMYRIESEDDLYSIGFDEYVDKDGICISEWSENVEDFIPEDAIRVCIKRSPEDEAKREIEILWDGKNENFSI